MRLAAQRDRLDSARDAARGRHGKARSRRVRAARDRRRSSTAARQPTPQRCHPARQAQAHEAEQRSADLTRSLGPTDAVAARRCRAVARPPPARPGNPAAPPRRVTGPTLVVDAVAYHLPGHTASGLPVGVGVIAVDPTVIPLGTRVFVPGYGPAVAADVGSAIKGNIIDLWMPTTAQALAWGRRTVTITVYG